jgi:hypothetical protein
MLFKSKLLSGGKIMVTFTIWATEANGFLKRVDSVEVAVIDNSLTQRLNDLKELNAGKRDTVILEPKPLSLGERVASIIPFEYQNLSVEQRSFYFGLHVEMQNIINEHNSADVYDLEHLAVAYERVRLGLNPNSQNHNVQNKDLDAAFAFYAEFLGWYNMNMIAITASTPSPRSAFDNYFNSETGKMFKDTPDIPIDPYTLAKLELFERYRPGNSGNSDTVLYQNGVQSSYKGGGVVDKDTLDFGESGIKHGRLFAETFLKNNVSKKAEGATVLALEALMKMTETTSANNVSYKDFMLLKNAFLFQNAWLFNFPDTGITGLSDFMNDFISSKHNIFGEYYKNLNYDIKA